MHGIQTNTFKRYLWYAFIAAILFSIFMLVYLVSSFHAPDVRFDNIQAVPYSDGWQQVSDNPITLTNTLPQHIEIDSVLCFQAKYTEAEVFINEKPIYRYQRQPGEDFRVPLGDVHLCIDIPREYQGQKITLQLTPEYPLKLDSFYTTILFGSKGSVLMTLFKENFSVFLFCAVGFLLGVIFLLLAGFVMAKDRKMNGKSFLYLGIFILLSTLWVLTDSDFMQFFTGNIIVTFYTSFFTFMLLPIPLLLFMKGFTLQDPPYFNVLPTLFILNFFISTALHVCGIIPLTRSVTITHILLAASIVYIIWICIKEWIKYRNDSMREVIVGIMILCITAFFSIIQFYKPSYSNNSFLFRIGLLCFFVLLSAVAFRRSIAVINDSTKAEVYKQLAYIDLMTKLGNRTAFEEKMVHLEQHLESIHSLAYVVFDINNLKSTNDTLGHSAGDALITNTANCIQRAFVPMGDCFRTGGDEFVVILTDTDKDKILSGIYWFSNYVKMYNAEAENPLDVAWGYAVSTEYRDMSVVELFNKADSLMYENKIKRK